MVAVAALCVPSSDTALAAVLTACRCAFPAPTIPTALLSPSTHPNPTAPFGAYILSIYLYKMQMLDISCVGRGATAQGGGTTVPHGFRAEEPTSAGPDPARRGWGSGHPRLRKPPAYVPRDRPATRTTACDITQCHPVPTSPRRHRHLARAPLAAGLPRSGLK